MQYREFGKTGVHISALGFGAMRLPMKDVGEKSYVDEDKAVPLIHKAFEQGVNYMDTAYGYCEGHSEIAVGKALKGWRDHVYLSTKLPLWNVKGQSDYRRLLEEQLKKLDVDWIDFYHFHGLSKDSFENLILKHNLLEEAVKAKEEGLIRYISFSTHEKSENIKVLIDVGIFSSMLCQYNLLDRSSEEGIAYAKEKGVGTVIMGPVGGGRLGVPSQAIQQMIPGGVKTTAEIALRFVLTNPNVDCALSGMSTETMLEENAAVASNGQLLSREEMALIAQALEENRRLSELYCTGCDYCMPCPAEVNIPVNFRLMNYHKVYNLTDYARSEYNQIGTNPWVKGKKAEACVECGLCEEKCPQNIEIRKQLKETAKALGL